MGLKGKETISLFVNEQDDKSAVYEFVFSPVEEGSVADPGDDTVFDVDYVFAKCTFTAPAQGGARTIGDGVFLVASGGDTTGTGVGNNLRMTNSCVFLVVCRSVIWSVTDFVS